MIQLLFLISLVSFAAAQKCALQFDGRVPQSATLASFDTSASLYNPSYVLGASTQSPLLPLFEYSDTHRSKMEQRPAIPNSQHLTRACSPAPDEFG